MNAKVSLELWSDAQIWIQIVESCFYSWLKFSLRDNVTGPHVIKKYRSTFEMCSLSPEVIYDKGSVIGPYEKFRAFASISKPKLTVGAHVTGIEEFLLNTFQRQA